MTGMTQRRSAKGEAAIGNRTRAIATMSPGEARGQNKKLKRSGSMPWWQRLGLAVILPVLFVVVWQ